MDAKETILAEIRKGKKAMKETVRLYKILEDVSQKLREHKREFPVELFTELDNVCKKRFDGEITTDGYSFYWKPPDKLY